MGEKREEERWEGGQDERREGGRRAAGRQESGLWGFVATIPIFKK